MSCLHCCLLGYSAAGSWTRKRSWDLNPGTPMCHVDVLVIPNHCARGPSSSYLTACGPSTFSPCLFLPSSQQNQEPTRQTTQHSQLPKLARHLCIIATSQNLNCLNPTIQILLPRDIPRHLKDLKVQLIILPFIPSSLFYIPISASCSLLNCTSQKHVLPSLASCRRHPPSVE